MIYVLDGHILRHAVEEILLHLLPTTTLAQADTFAPADDSCLSRLRVADDMAYAEAEVRLGGVLRTAERAASIAGLDGLAQKRVMAEIIKLTIYDAIVPALSMPPVWGSLTGVRPAKLARGMMARGKTRGETAQYFRENYHVTPERAALAMRASAYAQTALLSLPKNAVSLYISIPFCPSRCSYCSFVSQTTAQSGELIAPYLDALHLEIEQTGRLLDEAGLGISSVYIGGGTPTTLSAEQLTRLMDCIARTCNLSDLREYTVEAGRPDTITAEKLAAIRAGGADRISINPQTMNDEVLARIGRGHSAADVLHAYALAREAGFRIINMDTIAGLEGDTPQSFARTMDTLIDLGPENITVHSLAIKRGADLSDKAANAALHDSVKIMLDYAAETLSAAGYSAYYLYRQKFTAGGFENVGWCKMGTESLYNIVMMEEIQTIVSAGAGGVSKRVNHGTGKITRFVSPKYPKEYIEAVDRCSAEKRRLILEI